MVLVKATIYIMDRKCDERGGFEYSEGNKEHCSPVDWKNGMVGR